MSNTWSPDDIFSETFGFSGFRGMPDMGGSRAGWSRAGWNLFPRSMFGEDIFAQFRVGAEPSAAALRKAAPIEWTLPCTLEDLFKGTTKKMKISRDVPDASGITRKFAYILFGLKLKLGLQRELAQQRRGKPGVQPKSRRQKGPFPTRCRPCRPPAHLPKGQVV